MFWVVAGRPVRSVSECLSVLIFVGQTRHAQVRIPSYVVPVFRAILEFQGYVTYPWIRLAKMISAVLNPY
ncbi:hypothetical protein K439DRAFT_1638728 [Ramaria rubella]|nr:hypothetical protein K439DRAFT_1638728 [Ramaria rubella]